MVASKELKIRKYSLARLLATYDFDGQETIIKDLCKKLNIGKQMLYLYVNATTEDTLSLSDKKRQEIADYFNISVSDLLNNQ